MSTLRDEIAKIITPYGASGFEKADAVMALLRERAIDGEVWWCEPLHERGYWKHQCYTQKGRRRAKHSKCGLVWLLDLGET